MGEWLENLIRLITAIIYYFTHILFFTIQNHIGLL